MQKHWSDESELLDLLENWEMARSSGRRLTVEELCQDHPQLLDKARPHVARLEALSDILDGQSPFPSVPGFRIETRIGRGGMGTVFRARDLALGRTVAIKFPNVSGTISHLRFEREGKLLAQLRHQHIVSVHTAGLIGTSPYFVMDYIDGGTLLHHRPTFLRNIPATLELMHKVASAVGHAHSHGVLHRDLKPSNILLNSAGEPLVTDFGLAAVIGYDFDPQLAHTTPTRNLTLPGQIVGTPSYVAPEMYLTPQPERTAAADVWSLGVMLYELLTGHVPFRGKSTESMREILQRHTPRQPIELNSSLDAELNGVCLKCLEKSPTVRYQSAGELADELLRCREYAQRQDPFRTLPQSTPSPTGDSSTIPPSSSGDLGGTIRQSQEMEVLSADRSKPTTSLPGYEILETLGRGGMGIVYKARDTQLGRLAAIKMILGYGQPDPVTQARFQIEAEVIAMLQHPNIVQVYGFGEQSGQPYFALEYLDGGNLAQRLSEGQAYESRVAAEFVLKLADAMATAHAKGVVHRDLKPANILLTPEGEPKITDFGLAKHGLADLTASGAVMGTPTYMSPEQASGNTKEVGTSSDVYSLGVILYEMLTGKPPFRGDSIHMTLKMVMNDDPTPIKPSRKIPRDLVTICMHCLTKSPSNRYPTAAALADDLRAFLDYRPIAARPITRIGRVWRKCARYPALTSAVSLLLLLSVIVPPIVWSYRSSAIASAAAKDSEEKERIAEKRVAMTHEYYARTTEILALIAQRKSGWVGESLKKFRGIAELRPAYRENNEYDTRDTLELRSRLANIALEDDVVEIKTVGRTEPEYGFRLATSPNGKWLVAGDCRVNGPRTHCRLQLFDAQSLNRLHDVFMSIDLGNLLRKPLHQPDGTRHIAFSPDSKWLFVGMRSGTIYRYPMDQFPEGCSSWSTPTQICSFAFDPQSEWLYTSHVNQVVTMRKVAGDGTVIKSVKTNLAWNDPSLAYLDSSRTAIDIRQPNRPGLLVSDGGHVVYDPVTLEERDSPFAEAGKSREPLGTPLLNRAAHVLYFVGNGALTRHPVGNYMRTNQLTSFPQDAVSSLTAISPDGMYLATSTPDDQMSIINLADDKVIAMFSTGKLESLVFRADSRVLFVATQAEVKAYEIKPSVIAQTVSPGTHIYGFMYDAPRNQVVAHGITSAKNVHNGRIIHYDSKTGAQLSAFDHDCAILPSRSSTVVTSHPTDPKTTLVGIAHVVYQFQGSGNSIKELFRIVDHNKVAQNVQGLGYNSAGSVIWTAGGEVIEMWNWQGAFTGRWKRTWPSFTGQSDFRSLVVGKTVTVAAAPNGTFLAAALAKEVHVLSEGTAGERRKVRGLSLSGDESVVWAGTESGEVLAYEPKTGKIIESHQLGHGRIMALAVSPDGRDLAVAHASGTITIWRRLTVTGDPPIWSPALELRVGGRYGVQQLCFTNDGATLIAIPTRTAHSTVSGLRYIQIKKLDELCAEYDLNW